MKSKKQQLQQEQTPAPNNFSKPLSNGEEITLAQMIRNIVKEELQAHEVVLQEIVRSNLNITNELLVRLSVEGD